NCGFWRRALSSRASSGLRDNTAKRGPAYLFTYGANRLTEQSLDKSAETVLIFEARITAGNSTRRADHSGAINNNDLRNVQYLLLFALQVPVYLSFACISNWVG